MFMKRRRLHLFMSALLVLAGGTFSGISGLAAMETGAVGTEQEAFPRNELTKEEYEEITDLPEVFGDAGLCKTVKKNYVSEENPPYALCYTEYIEDAWWGGILVRTDWKKLPGTEIYQAVFEGELYEQ